MPKPVATPPPAEPVRRPPPAAPASQPRPASPTPAQQPPRDHDRDGIPDAVDAPRARVVVTGSRIEVTERIYFASRSAIIQPPSFPILDAVAQTLRANPQILTLEIQGHSDEHGDAQMKTGPLTSQRAEAVRHFLIVRGVEPARLIAHGYGSSRPLCGDHTDACQARNRRVEFVILRESQPQPSNPITPPAEATPYQGKLGEVMDLIHARKLDGALARAFAFRDEDAGDVMALIAVGEAAEALGKKRLAARAYGSIIDLFPSRADLRRFAGERLERLGEGSLDLAIDTFRKARADRPDHPASHRLLAYALLRAGDPAAAFTVIREGAQRSYPSGRFLGVDRILAEDVGLIAAAWARKQPGERAKIQAQLDAMGVPMPTSPSLRFVLNWETDANDVDFHIYDGRGNHAWFSSKQLASGGELYADVTTGYGPECFTIPGTPQAYPYRMQAHYYSRGPMGYGMGKLEILEHDGHGGLRFEERPFVIMVDRAFVDLGQVQGPLAKR
jgi:outer membrane protein OmpA-like peptidoglycan-associated protein